MIAIDINAFLASNLNLILSKFCCWRCFWFILLISRIWNLESITTNLIWNNPFSGWNACQSFYYRLNSTNFVWNWKHFVIALGGSKIPFAKLKRNWWGISAKQGFEWIFHENISSFGRLKLMRIKLIGWGLAQKSIYFIEMKTHGQWRLILIWANGCWIYFYLFNWIKWACLPIKCYFQLVFQLKNGLPLSDDRLLCVVLCFTFKACMYIDFSRLALFSVRNWE